MKQDNTEVLTLIGGVGDGQQRRLYRNQNRLQLPVFSESPPRLDKNNAIAKTVNIPTQNYRRMIVNLKHRSVSFMVADEITDEEAMQRILGRARDVTH